MPTIDAITSALITGNEANAILEQVDPDLDAPKSAQKLYKNAAKTVGAAIVLLSNNVNQVKPQVGE